MEGIIRPKDDSPAVGGNSFLGFQEASIIEIKDRQLDKSQKIKVSPREHPILPSSVGARRQVPFGFGRCTGDVW